GAAPPLAAQCGYEIVPIPEPQRWLFTGTGLNNLSQVCGYHEGGAFVWSAETGSVPLPEPEGPVSYAHAVNETGWGVGSSGEGWVWDGTQYFMIPTPPGTTSCWPRQINSAGQAVGTFNSYTWTRAFLWDNGTVVDLHPPEALNSYGVDISDRGEMLGEAAY